MEIPVPRPRLAIIGSRKASGKSSDVAGEIAKTRVKKRVVIVRGLAEGIDTAAHRAAIESGGRTIAVLGTPLDRVYPQKNMELQQEIMRSHLAISQFPTGYAIEPGNFVMRNRTMALTANASVIVEAGETSGSLYQGWEALRLGRPLFIWTSLVHTPSLKCPAPIIRHAALQLPYPTNT